MRPLWLGCPWSQLPTGEQSGLSQPFWGYRVCPGLWERESFGFVPGILLQFPEGPFLAPPEQGVCGLPLGCTPLPHELAHLDHTLQGWTSPES